MKASTLLSHIDHTNLKQTATTEAILALCREAADYGTASVCIPPAFLAAAHDQFPTLNLCTVIGFPNGYQHPAVKCAEAKQAIADGAHEIDTVIHLGAVKDRRFAQVLDELKALREATAGHILKVIVETCWLTEPEKIKLCHLVTEAGAEFIKTSTGFGTAGATLEDVALFRREIGSQVQIKAAGGIRTRQAMEAFLNAGCSRIGTSSAAILFAEADAERM